MQRIGRFLLVALLAALLISAQVAPAPLPTSSEELQDLASRGDIRAQVAFGYSRYVARDYAQAAKWFFAAVGQGKTDADSAYAYYALGVIHQQGLGIAPDPVHAYVFLKIAALLDSQDAEKALETATRTLTSAQLAQAQGELHKTFEAAALAQGGELSSAERSFLLGLSNTDRKYGPQESAPFKFANGQRVYVVAIERPAT
jgi:TPR repeat protein